jgi:NADH dehydrogenase FAD-containing subunit
VWWRLAIINCFEQANIPSLPEEEIRSALTFVVVGAGPTGVEFTAELRDWIEVEGKRYYSRLLQYVKILLVEAGDAVLAVFDENLQQAAMKQLTCEAHIIKIFLTCFFEW